MPIMSLVASSISGAAYVMGNADDKDSGNGFEFTRRKRWPQLLLQELSGAAVFCLKPTYAQGAAAEGSSTTGQSLGWKILFVSPSVGDMLNVKPQEIEGHDFFELIYGADQLQLHSMFTSLVTPSLNHQPSDTSASSSSTPGAPSGPGLHTTMSHTHTAYIRMLSGSSSQPASSCGNADSGRSTTVWEIRAHATGVEGLEQSSTFGLGGGGTMVPQTQSLDMKGKAVWVMGRRVGGEPVETENGNGNPQSLDAFLELKLENERLREELRELQLDLDEYDEYSASRSTYIDPSPSRQQAYNLPSSDSDHSSSPSSSRSSSPSLAQPQKNKPGRPPKDKDAAREKKKVKKINTMAAQPSRGNGNGGGEGEGMHVCVTCGRTDSPEWRKGPLGPKTLCNACGLRWAKRNSTAPTRKERKQSTK